MSWQPGALKLPTKQVFQANTGGHGKRNTIKLIDHALDAWHVPPHNLEKTIRVYKECRHWIKAKDGKTTGQSLKRKGEVNKVISRCTAYMGKLDPNLFAAFQTFNARKLANPQGKPGTKSMHGVYQHERSAYLSSGKQRAPSASLMHARMQEDTKQLKSFKKGGVFSNSPREFSDLSESEYKKLDKLTGSELDVVYLRKMSRLRHMLLINNHKFTDIAGHLFTSNQFQEKGNPYAMDRYGSVFSADLVNDEAITGQWNHSSFNAGKEVTCAGMILVKDGVLKKIDNNSGHYKPNRQNLWNCLDSLIQDQVDISQCQIWYMDYVSSPGEQVIWEYSAADFHANNNANRKELYRGEPLN